MLTFTVGNIWDRAREDWIVIPTNLGWKTDGRAVLGAGLAAQAAGSYPDLPYWYGAVCKSLKGDPQVSVYDAGRLLMLPTKALNVDHPWESFRYRSSLPLIDKSLERLNLLTDNDKERFGSGRVLLPYVGCGLGRLKKTQVRPLLHRHLESSPIQFVVVDYHVQREG